MYIKNNLRKLEAMVKMDLNRNKCYMDTRSKLNSAQAYKTTYTINDCFSSGTHARTTRSDTGKYSPPTLPHQLGLNATRMFYLQYTFIDVSSSKVTRIYLNTYLLKHVPTYLIEMLFKILKAHSILVYYIENKFNQIYNKGQD